MSNKLLTNPRHNFGYIQLPEVIDTLFPEDKEEVCWAPATLIERESDRVKDLPCSKIFAH